MYSYRLRLKCAGLLFPGKPVPSYEPLWFTKEKDPLTGNVIHVYKGEYWSCKERKDWSKCPDLF
jgi:hypothetical protein